VSSDRGRMPPEQQAPSPRPGPRRPQTPCAAALALVEDAAERRFLGNRPAIGARPAATATDKASLGCSCWTGAGQHPDPGGQSGRQIENFLAGCHQLLGQQVAQTARGLDGSDAGVERGGPLQQLVDLAASRSHPRVSKLGLSVVDGYRGVRTLVGIDADHRFHCVLQDRGSWSRGGHS
jgi:hypothetical protein